MLQRQPGDCADDQERQADEGDDLGEQADTLLNELEAIRRVEPGLWGSFDSRVATSCAVIPSIYFAAKPCLYLTGAPIHHVTPF